jgi:UDP-N-acetylmuramate dehydrogenase
MDEVELVAKGDVQGIVRAEAGAKTALLVSKTIKYGLAGLERFLGVPGTIGGAVYNNAHYLEDLLSAYIKRVEVIDEDGQVKWLKQADCDFGYDYSRFHNTNEVILQAEFLLPKGDVNQSKEKVKQATVYRAKTQPLGKPSSGCIFKNVANNPDLRQRFPQFAQREHVPTGFLIDQAGLKGAAEGDIEVSHKHAAFFVNQGQGTAANVKKLIKRVQAKVEAEYGVRPEPEVFWLE